MSEAQAVDEEHARPEGAPDELVEAVGRASEAFEYVERVRGHLYAAHQLMGRADFLFEEAADLLDGASCPDDADRMRAQVVGRNLLDGRWTFQIMEEFDDVYYDAVKAEVRGLEERHMAGRRHVFEAEMKEGRRTRGRPAHEATPAAKHARAG
ncbi:MAG TPA: hypothetical protein VD926_00975 [Acidimicrobiales bacterium]|nr:hypothetical protein [Acidimicrobiales bacterium]